MAEYAKVGTEQISLLILGAILMIITPPVIAVIWTKKKKEKFTTILIGAATFLLFALILEKPIQNVLIFPSQMGLTDHAISRFINARPILWAFAVGASMLVFYANRDKKKFWLYPLAILLHTGMDFTAGLTLSGVWHPSTWILEGIVGIVGVSTFFGAFFLLYKKDAGAYTLLS